MSDIGRLFARRAALLRELADLELEVGRALSEAVSPAAPDESLGVAEAARYMGEPVETFRRRLDYRRALLTRPKERRLRYSRAELDRIKRDRLAANAVAH